MAQSSNSADESGLTPEQIEGLSSLAASLTPGQCVLAARWLLGRLETGALTSDQLEVEVAEAPVPSQGGELTIFYGSHTGHAAGVAKSLAASATAKGWKVTLSNLADVARGDFKLLRNLALILSTHGEGDPPESAAASYDYLLGNRAPKLGECRFAVLGLGDKTYKNFCKAASEVDKRLAELGATRLLERVSLDVDYQAGADAWSESVLKSFEPYCGVPAPKPRAASLAQSTKKTHRYDREHPFEAEVVEKILLSGRGSTQHFVHLELSLEGSNLKYLPGDAIGIRPQNDPEYVEQLIERLGASSDTKVTLFGEELTLGDALQRRLEIRLPKPSVVAKYAERAHVALREKLADAEGAQAYLAEREWLDVMSEYPSTLSAQEFVSLLPELGSRSYSIASSLSTHADEVHLLVSRVGYDAHGRPRRGVASSYLADRVNVGDKLAVWIEANRNFRLPEDPNVPVILIGAGTGIAPFRAFLEERAVTSAKGKNWVIFGNRSFRADFTYQSEWLKFRERGVLTRMDVAFSRDQANKVYVTDKLREQGATLFEWLEEGAIVYLCGDRAKLSTSIDQALEFAIVEYGRKSPEEAKLYLERLSSSGRYRKDVY
jgi:sulfite reductase (NADPH) flavoprotein alpha-component